MAALVPELYVQDIGASLRFCASFGFTVRYQRHAEGFALIERGGAELMLEEPTDRVWLGGPLERPFGRGINFQINVDGADALFARRPADVAIVMPCETRTYQRTDDAITVRQFVVADPDGYLLRFSEIVAIKPTRPPATP